MPTPDQVRAAVEAYARHLGDRDKQAWLDLFTDDAALTDPVPGEAMVGRPGLGEFWDSLAAMAPRYRMELHAVHVCSEQAAAVYTMLAGPEGGGGATFDGVEIFTVDDAGRITAATAYWDPATIRQVEPASTGAGTDQA